ncbi:MAG: ABC transporter substrate-binding protein, partial [Alphaproteobacteria bacterium]
TRNNIRLIAKPADNSTKVIGTAERLIPEVDAIYVPLDNTVAAVIPSLVRLGQDNSTGKKVPLFASDPEGVRQGAVATIGFTHYQEGMQTGKIVARVLRGEFPGNIPVRAPDTSALYINETAFKLSGLTIPNELLSQHSEVVRFE